MSWGKEAIGSVAEILPGFAFKSSELGEEGTPVLKIGNINDDGTVAIERVQRLPFQYRHERHAKYELKDRDIIIAMTGATAGKAGRLRAQDGETFLLNQRVAKFCPLTVDPDYLWFVVSTDACRSLFYGLGGGAAQPNMSGPQIASVEIPMPPNDVQKRIAAILSAYDDLIENNRRRIRLLEEAARQLYKEWFVRFRFPGHEHVKTTNGVPEGWERATLGAVCDLKWGDTNTTKDSYVDEGYDAYSAKGLDGKLDHFDFDQDGIVISAIGAQCGKTWIARGHWSCIKNTMRMFPTHHQISVEYLFYASERSDFWQRRGGAQPFISQGDARGLPMLIPPVTLAEQYQDFSNSSLKLAENLHLQNQQLAKARDLLLPRLMNGTLTV